MTRICSQKRLYFLTLGGIIIHWMWMLWMPNWLNGDLLNVDVMNAQLIECGDLLNVDVMNAQLIEWRSIACGCYECPVDWMWRSIECGCCECRIDWIEIYVLSEKTVFLSTSGVSIGCGCYECGLDWIEEENSISHTKGYPTGKLRDKFPHHKSQS